MFKLTIRPLFVLMIVALALLVTACAPATESAANNAGNAALDNSAKSAGENATDRVKMVFTQQDDGREFFGTVEAMDGNVWTVSGQKVTIGAGTEIKNSIAVGSQVKVHTIPQADGTVLVREIELTQGDDGRDDSASPTSTAEREFFGTVEAMSGNVWTISGQQVMLSAGTEIKNSIAIGDRVKVHALPQADGTLLVREIELAQGDDDQNDDRNDDGEFYGTVEAINGNVWTISGRQVTVGAGTEVKGNIAVGSQVKVHTLLQSDGTLLAREIELDGMDDDDMDDDRDDDWNDDSGDDSSDDRDDDWNDDSGDDSSDDWNDDSGDDSGDDSSDDRNDDSDDDMDDDGDDDDSHDDDHDDDDDDDDHDDSDDDDDGDDGDDD